MQAQQTVIMKDHASSSHIRYQNAKSVYDTTRNVEHALKEFDVNSDEKAITAFLLREVNSAYVKFTTNSFGARCVRYTHIVENFYDGSPEVHHCEHIFG